jgi:predicted translin family RNA/ssDNA-binding protein
MIPPTPEEFIGELRRDVTMSTDASRLETLAAIQLGTARAFYERAKNLSSPEAFLLADVAAGLVAVCEVLAHVIKAPGSVERDVA